MRKLPQDFAFPLGLGSKKHTANHTVTAVAENTTGGGSGTAGGNNGANVTNSGGPKTTTNTTHNSNTLPGSSNGDSSPRAPCQDLDTINL